MPAPAAYTLFGAADLPVNARFLSNIAFLTSPDKPVETSTVVGNYAISEMCVAEGEAADFKMYLDTLRSAGQAAYVSKIAAEIRQANSRAANETAEALESEFARFKKTFFLRVRSFQVLSIATGEPQGRIVTFPDQISDDYGTNLDVHNEQGISQSMVNRAQGAEALPTVYVGHGQGSAMAQLCACASGNQAIIFDGTTLSNLLVGNAVAHQCIKSEPVAETERQFNVIFYRTNASASKQDATLAAVDAAAKKVAAQEAKEAAAAKAAAEAEARKNGQQIPKPEEEDKSAEDFFKTVEYISIGGIIPAAAQARFNKTGRYNAKALSDMFVDYTASVQAAQNPYPQA